MTSRLGLTLVLALQAVTLPPHERPSAGHAPLSAADWRAAVDECEGRGGMAVVRASRVMGVSAGVGCAQQFGEN
jgi:hypothetical protein